MSDGEVCMAFDYGDEIKGICETIKRNIDVSSDTELIKELEYLETRLNLLEKKNEYEIKKAQEEEKGRVTSIISQLETRVNGFMVDLEHFKKEVESDG